MDAKELGNMSASDMTYRQAIVLALLPEWVRGCRSWQDYSRAWQDCNDMAESILAREAQEAGDE